MDSDEGHLTTTTTSREDEPEASSSKTTSQSSTPTSITTPKPELISSSSTPNPIDETETKGCQEEQGAAETSVEKHQDALQFGAKIHINNNKQDLQQTNNNNEDQNLNSTKQQDTQLIQSNMKSRMQICKVLVSFYIRHH